MIIPRRMLKKVNGTLKAKPIVLAACQYPLSYIRGGTLIMLNPMVDYSLSNYCATCLTKLPKEILRCPDCMQKVRTRPWHRSKIVDLKRV